jgi:hypothetical protein
MKLTAEVRKINSELEIEPHYLASSRIMLKNHLDRFADPPATVTDGPKFSKYDPVKGVSGLRTSYSGISTEDPISKYYSSTLDPVKPVLE